MLIGKKITQNFRPLRTSTEEILRGTIESSDAMSMESLLETRASQGRTAKP